MRDPSNAGDRGIGAIGAYDLSAGITGSFWFDYVADLGDGFSATYAIAERLAPSMLSPGHGNDTVQFGLEDGVALPEPVDLPAGQLLVMGGDQVYPAPVRTVEREPYWDRTVGPYELACVESDRNAGTESPRAQRLLLAIPGNHDWYDGLVSFLGQFCSRRAIGFWRTVQQRSYFAARLPHGWWMWGVDIAFDGPMDELQIQYFKSASEQVGANESVILCTAKPAWLEARDGRDNRYQLIQWFLEQIDESRAALDSPRPRLDVPIMLSGDKHFYARHAYRDPALGAITKAKVVSGGGGASLSTTQTVPSSITIREKTTDPHLRYEESLIWPTPTRSRSGISGSAFVRIPQTASFCALLAALYLVLSYLIRDAVASDKHVRGLTGLVEQVGSGAFWRVWRDLAFAAVQYTWFWIVFVPLVLALYTLAARGGVPTTVGRLIVGAAHAVLHIVGVLLVMSAALYLGQHHPAVGIWSAVAVATVTVGLTIGVTRHEIRGWGVVGVVIAAVVAAAVAAVFVLSGGNLGTKYVTSYQYVLVVGCYVVSTLLFTLYLFLAQLAGWNTTELAGGLRHSGWKEFMRVRVEADSLTFFTLGMRHVPRRWVRWSEEPNGRSRPDVKGKVGTLRLVDTFTVVRSHGTASAGTPAAEGVVGADQ